MNNDDCIKTEVLVVGGGIAGMLAALEAQKQGVKVCLISKGKMGKSGSSVIAQTAHLLAEGGLDPENAFYKELYEGGGRINNPALLKTVIEKGYISVKNLSDYGINMAAKPKKHGEKNLYRTIQSKGRDLTLPLRNKVIGANIPVYENASVLKLLKYGKRAAGAVVEIDNKFVFIKAKAVIFATGGYARIYSLNDNTKHTTGEAIITAFEAGAELMDLEFVQFYPYWIVEPRFMDILTPLFFHGAKLKNEKGEYFLDKYPRGELENRDLVSREIMLQNKVFLDLSNVKEAVIKDKNPQLYKIIKNTTSYSEFLVKPVAHFTMGGIKINEKCKTSVEGLFACGECSAGLHGANRIGGMALTECAVFGPIAGKEAAQYAKNVDDINYSDVDTQIYCPKIGEDSIENIENTLPQIMYNDIGIIRNESGLKRAIEKIDLLKEELANKKPVTPKKWYRLKNMLELASLVAKSAFMRKESRGAHYRSDYPEINLEWQINLIHNFDND